MTLRIGLAGLGVHGGRYARHLLQGDVAGARLTAVCRNDERAGREYAAQHGLEFVLHPEDLAEHPRVDAVILALPPDLHPAAAEACLSRGRPLLVEKPLAPDVARASRLRDRVRETGTPLLVGQSLRWDPIVERLHAKRESIGELRMLALNQRFEPSGRPWIDRPGCGGLFLNTGVHGFDLLRHLSGAEPVSVWAESRNAVTSATEDEFVATLRFEPGGLLAVMDNARSTDSRSGRIELVGATGQLWGDHVHRTLQRVVGREATDLGPVPEIPTLPRVVQTFVDCLAADRPMPVTVDDGLAAVEMVEAGLRSAAEGRAVRIDEVRVD